MHWIVQITIRVMTGCGVGQPLSSLISSVASWSYSILVLTTRKPFEWLYSVLWALYNFNCEFIMLVSIFTVSKAAPLLHNRLWQSVEACDPILEHYFKVRKWLGMGNAWNRSLHAWDKKIARSYKVSSRLVWVIVIPCHKTKSINKKCSVVLLK